MDTLGSNPFDTVAAGDMATAVTNTQLHGISSETQQGIADAYLGADMGAEMANLTKYQILMQAGTSALNSANQSAQTVMGMFR
jgi:flagellin-like hook-associated protein FlgL